ncbi:DUF1097 domain-containing protein [Pseudonocardia sp.]|uniref:DUF1097 domain-containing protein n=1 Tax=Pseudonocardia sp. TaxID=60912 RepID=UPI003D0EAF86
MKLPVALALVIGLLGAILTYLYVGPLAALGLFVPATFLGAASYFAAGGTTAALTPSLASNIWGVLGGTVALFLVGTAGSPLLIGVYVGLMTAVVVLGAVVPLLGFVPGTVIGFATTAGFGLLTSASALDLSLPTGPFTVMALSFAIGALYGWVASLLVGRLVGSAAAESTPA